MTHCKNTVAKHATYTDLDLDWCDDEPTAEFDSTAWVEQWESQTTGVYPLLTARTVSGEIEVAS